MKYLLISLILLYVVSAAGENINILPPKPVIGEKISIIYSVTETDNVMKEATALTCEALIVRGDLDMLLIEIPMKEEGGKWVGSFTLDDPQSQFIVFQFVSGDLKDNNKGNPVTRIVHGKNNEPVKGAHLGLGNFFLTGRFWDIKGTVDLIKAKNQFETELKLYPDSWKASVGLWDLSLKDKAGKESMEKIKRSMEKLHKKYKNDEDVLSAVISGFEKAGDSAKADELRQSEIQKNPKGKIAQQLRSDLMWKETDSNKRVELMEIFLNDFPSMDAKIRESYRQNLIYAYSRVKEFDKAYELLSKIEKPDPGMYNSLAWPLIEKGEQLDKAIAWAKQGIELCQKQTAVEKPSYMRVKDWEENRKYTLGMILDTYGTGLLKSGKYGEAVLPLQEAYEKSGGADPDMNAHYVEALLKSNEYGKALEAGLDCVKKGKDSEQINLFAKEAYAGTVNPGSVFDSLGAEKKKIFEDMFSEAYKIKIAEIRKKLVQSRVSLPAADFTLKDMNGLSVTLSDLKGKVVIVDFWATWCGPCKMSFPYLQKVYEKYQNNENVKFLAVNSWERQKDYNAQLENAKKFIEDNKYTFPVLLDEKIDDQYKVIGDYEVEGIPTKFIIDKSGRIAFKSIGFDGPGMEDELTQQIEMILTE